MSPLSSTKEHCELGIIGLGVMGRNFLLNLADHGFAVAGYDLNGAQVVRLEEERGKGRHIRACRTLEDFVASLKRPRVVMLLVPAGKPVDAVLKDLQPHLAVGDIVLDGGNSHFRDTERRLQTLGDAGIHFLGTGISGGEEGARHGPCIMPGGSLSAYEHVEHLLTKAAAEVDGEPCVVHLGDKSAGHYVKMVHNGIEYGIMQLIAEVFDVLRRALGRTTEQIATLFAQWREGPLSSFLVEITADILTVRDQESGRPLLDLVHDAARQKGTGRWTSEEALDLQVPTPTIDAAVTARNLSSLADQREEASSVLKRPERRPGDEPERWDARLAAGLEAGMLLTYAQGFALLHRASQVYEYGLDLAEVARIWRGGCIIRAAMLEDLREALAGAGDRPNVLLHSTLGERVNGRIGALAEILPLASAAGVPLPALSATLAYFDGLRSTRLPASLIQAQRDSFGAHGYERTDREGAFHSDWSGKRGGAA